LLPDYSEDDSTVPPFPETDLPVSVTMIVHLNRDRPLSEPKWVKTGDVQEWLKSLLGRMFWVAGDAAEDGWEKKIEVKDPDPVSFVLLLYTMSAGLT
jgi:20S proteasome subunit alpha 6